MRKRLIRVFSIYLRKEGLWNTVLTSADKALIEAGLTGRGFIVDDSTKIAEAILGEFWDTIGTVASVAVGNGAPWTEYEEYYAKCAGILQEFLLSLLFKEE